VIHGREHDAADQDLPPRIALALVAIRAREQSTLRRSQSRHAFIDRLNPRFRLLMLCH
jgi:hypothetical protein